MDPIDFTRPETFGQVGAGGPGASLDLNRQSPAPSTAEALRLRRAVRWLLFWIVLAPLSWAALAALLAFMGTADPLAAASAEPSLLAGMLEPSFVARLRLLAWMTADTLFWPVLVVAAFLLLRGLLGEFLIRRMLARRAAAPADGALSVAQLAGGAVQEQQDGLDGLWRIGTLALGIVRIVPFVATALGVIWATMAAFAFVNNGDPWEALPWVTPPYLEQFLARHPALTLERSDDKVRLRDRQGRSIGLYGRALAGAQLSLESCPAALRADQLGGIPPYPGIPCVAQAQLLTAQGQTTLYLFELANGSDSAAVFAHFRRWADEHASSSGSSSSDVRHYLSASSRDDAWRLEMNSSNGGATSIVIRRQPRAP